VGTVTASTDWVVHSSGPPPAALCHQLTAEEDSRSARIRYRGVSATPPLWTKGRWQGKTRPTTQSMRTGSDRPTTSSSVRRRGNSGGETARKEKAKRMG